MWFTRFTYMIPAAIVLAVGLAAGCGGDGDTATVWQQRYEKAANRAENAEKRVDSLKRENEELSDELRSLSADLKSSKEKQVELKTELSSVKAEMNSRVRSLRSRLEKEEERAREARKEAKNIRDRIDKLQGELSETAKKLRETGLKLFRTDEYLAAEVMLKRAAEFDDATPEVAYAIGYCRGHVSDYEDAVTWYEKAIDRLREREDPNDLLFAKALNNCGAAYEELDKPEKARELYAEATSVHDKFAPAHFNLGRLYRQKLDSPDEAINHLRRHVALGGSRSAAAREAIQNMQSSQNRASSGQN